MGRGDEDFFAELGHPALIRDAEASRVVFARVKGYPAWPVRVSGGLRTVLECQYQYKLLGGMVACIGRLQGPLPARQAPPGVLCVAAFVHLREKASACVPLCSCQQL
jgi:hypothetical protein